MRSLLIAVTSLVFVSHAVLAETHIISVVTQDSGSSSNPGGAAFVVGDVTPPTQDVPEPVSAALIAAGLAGMSFMRRRT